MATYFLADIPLAENRHFAAWKYGRHALRTAFKSCKQV